MILPDLLKVAACFLSYETAVWETLLKMIETGPIDQPRLFLPLSLSSKSPTVAESRQQIARRMVSLVLTDSLPRRAQSIPECLEATFKLGRPFAPSMCKQTVWKRR
jgi:hypothetical protein